MKKVRIALLGLVLLFGMVFLGLNATDVSAFKVLLRKDIVKTAIPTTELVRTADNFIVLFDASGSMDATYKDTGMRRIEVAKKILQERNQMLPDLGYNAGLYLFSPSRPYYDMKPYDREEFGRAIDKLPTTTRVPPSRAEMMKELDNLLSGLSGRTAVFVFTDGAFIAPIKTKISPVAVAKELAAKHDFCLYPISSAQTPKQKKNVQALASVNACSRVVPFDALYGRPEYVGGALFALEDIILVKKDVITRVVAVKAKDILFDFDSSSVRTDYHEELDDLGKFLQSNPEAYVIFSGFTDSTGPEEYNLWLSRRRAESVAAYLVDNFNIDPFRIVPLWYGDADPVASNATAAGRAKNRRVVTIIAGFSNL